MAYPIMAIEHTHVSKLQAKKYFSWLNCAMLPPKMTYPILAIEHTHVSKATS
jgi:hypothetical protein